MDPELIRGLLDAGVQAPMIDSVFTGLGFQPANPPQVRSLPENVLGGFRAEDQTILLNRDHPERLADVLLHEMTHEAAQSRTDPNRPRIGPSALHAVLDRVVDAFRSASPDARTRLVEDYYGKSDTTDVLTMKANLGGLASPVMNEVAARTFQRGFDLVRTGADPAPVERDFPGTMEVLEFLQSQLSVNKTNQK